MTFRIERHDALLRMNAGESDVVLPFGTFRIRGVFRAAPPPPALPLSA